MARKCAGQIAAEGPNSLGGTQVSANWSLAINPTLDFVSRDLKGSGLACSKTADAYIPITLAAFHGGFLQLPWAALAQRDTPRGVRELNTAKLSWSADY
jgi:hypothetical protein